LINFYLKEEISYFSNYINYCVSQFNKEMHPKFIKLRDDGNFYRFLLVGISLWDEFYKPNVFSGKVREDIIEGHVFLATLTEDVWECLFFLNLVPVFSSPWFITNYFGESKRSSECVMVFPLTGNELKVFL
jgi:hypothetical protein